MVQDLLLELSDLDCGIFYGLLYWRIEEVIDLAGKLNAADWGFQVKDLFFI